jgi:hypothetical protein
MRSRVAFVVIAGFWVTMNVLLWRQEYGSHGSDEPVPAALVWRKILTAPDASSLSIYQDGERSGFCEFSTSVETEMAKLDEDRPPPEGVATRAGYQIRLNGNTSLGDFTNRLRFDGRLSFSATRQWRELYLKLSSHTAAVEIHSVATNQTVQLKITNEGVVIERELTFAELADPNAVVRALAGNFGGGFLGLLDLSALPPESPALSQPIVWDAHRDRLKIGNEPVSVYRLETRMLDYPIVIYASTLGEILRVELPAGFIATLDIWNKP